MTHKKKFNLHFRRFEFKYFLPSEIVDLIIPKLLCYMDWDPYVDEHGSYQCTSLYLDTPGLKAYHEKEDGILNRKKLRIRTYADNIKSDTPLFFEIKRKSGDIVLKDRAVLSGSHLDDFLTDPLSVPQLNETQNFGNEFLFDYLHFGTRPTLAVRYQRRPLQSKFHTYFRVTFDSQLEFAVASDNRFPTEFEPYQNEYVIMEVKFNGTLPGWFYDIITLYQLKQSPACKYCFGIDHFDLVK